MSELITIWDGSHHDADGDLLCCEKIVAKREPPPPEHVEPRKWRSGDVAVHDHVRDVLIALLKDTACTEAEIRRHTGFSRRAITTAIQRLRRGNMLTCSATGYNESFRGRPPSVRYGIRP